MSTSTHDDDHVPADLDEACYANWRHGEDVIKAGSSSDEDAKRPNGWRSPILYMRIVPQPGPSLVPRQRAAASKSWWARMFDESALAIRQM
jgi:hypothetical protein